MSLRTIFAPTTPAGRSALAMVRVSGPNSRSVLQKLAPRATFVPRKARLTDLFDSTGQLLDQALVLYFRGPNSFTGDDIVEFHLHGSPVVTKAVMNAIGTTGLAQLAEPGEFTRRAFSSGRIDLAQVEGIRDLLAAETEFQRQNAVNVAKGSLSHIYEQWRRQLVNAYASLTASIDFSEDNDLANSSLIRSLKAGVEQLLVDVRSHIAGAQRSELVRKGVRVALVGAPNAGKSSLLNKLADRSVALVSDIPGTTRDVIEVSMDMNGHKVVLSDTAGLRESCDTIEAMGIERTRQVLEDAAIILVLTPSGTSSDPNLIRELAKWKDKDVIYIESKSDLHDPYVNENPQLSHRQTHISPVPDPGTRDHLAVSSVTGSGIDEMITLIAEKCAQIIKPEESDGGFGATERTRILLESLVVPGLERAAELVDSDVVCASGELQMALEGIGKITGRGVAVDEVLDVVFGEFCIGK